ncbi:MAG TPA: glycosyltransferase family 4 protein [Terriglobales bacterium]|nr:glycosyltransferase family 4 protein [Terriglobales bacterium]
MMKILWVKANKLLPVHSGGDIRSYNIARHMARQHSLTFLSYYDGERDPDYERELAGKFTGAVSISTGKEQPSAVARVLDYVRHLPSSRPYAVERFASPEVRSRLSEWFAQRAFDVAICDFLDAAVNFPGDLPIPTVLFQHNVESEIWRRHAETEANPVKRRAYAIEFRKMLRYESSMVRKFHHVIAVSEHDRSLMEEWVEGARITVVPTGVDLEQYRPDFSRKPAARVVMFVGAMDWEPNVDAMEYFCREIWPSVVANAPGAVLRIVGRNPGERVRRLASASVQVTGRVPSVLEHLREASLVVVPLRIGGGTRLKILESLALGTPVVSTSKGAEGLDANDGEHILIADRPEVFAKSVLNLLQTPELHDRLAGQGKAIIQEKYDTSVIGKKLDSLLERVAVHAGCM